MRPIPARRNICAVALFSLFSVVAFAAPAPSLPTGAPGARPRVPVVAKVAQTFQLASTLAARSIVLPAPTAAQLATLNTLPLPATRAKRTAIGLGRAVPAVDGTLDMSTLKWQTGADGNLAAQIRVESTGAAGIRVALKMQGTDPDVVLRVAGSNGGTVFGPFPANQVAETTATLGEWWTPTLEGSAAIIEVSVPPGYDTRNLALAVPMLSHLTRVGAGLAPSAKVDGNLGTSGTCETNWSCSSVVPQSAGLTRQADAVARILFTEQSGDSFLCSGTLLNDSVTSSTPYFFSAAHCMDNAYAAQTTNFYWFFDAPVDANICSHTAEVGLYQLQATGAFLLGISVSQDWALIRVNSAPPSGTWFSAWSAVPITSGAIQDLHHPSGDTKKYSAGGLFGYVSTQIDNETTNLPQINDDLMQVIWNQGVTEGGSSGSGLLTYDPGTDNYTVHGALTGGGSACETPKDADVYSRLDQMLPLMRDYLTPNATLPNTAVVIEYYNANLDDYFMTKDSGEIAALDANDPHFPGWVRTGLRFLAYTTPQAGASPVCRFYLNPPYGSSHFYSAALSDCQALINNPVQFPGWTEETTSAFYINVPDAGGNCPANTSPVWRFYNGAQINHRFTTDISIHDTLIQEPDTWAYEGVKMCALNGS